MCSLTASLAGSVGQLHEQCHPNAAHDITTATKEQEDSVEVWSAGHEGFIRGAGIAIPREVMC